MLDRFYNLWEFLRTSLWLVPVLLMAVGVLLAWAVLTIDATDAGREAGKLWWLQSGGPDDARELLSSLLSSLITMTSLVFSMTLVVLSLAANHFGSRLIRNFMADPTTQVVLGTFVMTIVYCLLVLRAVSDTDGGHVPHMAVTLGTALALLSLVLLILFIHNIGRSIVADTVVERVARELDDAISRLLPADAGAAPALNQALNRDSCSNPDSGPDSGPDPDPEAALPPDFERCSVPVILRREGYVQAIEYDNLAALGQRFDCVFRIDVRAGEFIIAGSQALRLWPAAAAEPPVLTGVDAAVLIGQSRTPTQDIEFPIRHLVEVAVRALSPAVNDPFTALAVIDRLGASLARLMERDFHRRLYHDACGSVRVVAKAPRHGDLLDAAFHQIRQAGAEKPAVIIRLLDAIARVAEFAGRPDQREALLRHAGMIAGAGCRAVAEPQDQADIARRYETVCHILSSGGEPAFAPHSRGVGRSS